MPSLWLVGFQGATHRAYRRLHQRDPRLITGHVGLSVDGGGTIWGFTPVTPALSFTEARTQLRQDRTFPGRVTDDTAICASAVRLAAQGILRTPVYLWEQSYDDVTWLLLTTRLRAVATGEPLPTVRYGWQSGQPGVYNCATWPVTLGVTIPEQTGELRRYIPALALAAGGRRYGG